MKPSILMCSGSLTGYGFVFGLRPEFDAAINVHGFADTESIGNIDAPENISAGGMRFCKPGAGLPIVAGRL